MQKITLFLCLGLLFCGQVLADDKCFIATENNKVIKQEGNCKLRYAPCSTFKIAISLMAYNEGLLIDETHPELPFKKGYTDWLDRWKQPHNPTLWMKNSCVWYSQFLTRKLGMTKFKEYVKKFNYGNQNVSGDKGKNNGLTNSWLSSSLEISPDEQMVFLENLIANKLPVSILAHEMTKNILFVEELPGGWKLFGKTGNGSQISKDKSQQLDLQQGWFIGWVQKNEQIIIFINHITDDSKQGIYASLRAKEEAKEKLLLLISTK